MDNNRTKLNKQLSMQVPTIINRELQAEKNAAKDKQTDDLLKAGSQLRGSETYTVRQRLDTASGEADLYLCSGKSECLYVAKIYKRENPLKEGVAGKITGIHSPYVARVFEVFDWNDRTVVILPYYKNGSLAGRTFTPEELRKTIIPDINEGLKAIHTENLIHKDLKPANIMLQDDGKSVAIIDFGISSLLQDGNTVLLTQTGLTPVYSAPEVFNGLALVEADYYSFGITLYELFCGKTPFSAMSDMEIARFTTIQKIPLPNDMPPDLQRLISALTYPDIRNRHDKNNPNRRWTYDEVVRWLKGEQMPSPGGFDVAEMNPFVFRGKTYQKIQELIEAMGMNWDDGKKILFHGTLAAHVKATNLDLYQLCSEAIQRTSQSNGKDDAAFFEFLYRAAPQLEAIYWKGRKFESMTALGRSVLEALWQGNDLQYKLYDAILSEKILSLYVSARAPENETLKKAVISLEQLWLSMKEEKKDIRLVYYSMAYLLSGQIILKVDNEEIHTVNELADYLNEKTEESVKALIDSTHRFVSYDGELDVQVEAWLLALGKRLDIERWREILQRGDDHT